jgi:hypothetical protein
MGRVVWLALLVLAAALAAFAYGCGVQSFGGCAATDTCPPSDGGADGGSVPPEGGGADADSGVFVEGGIHDGASPDAEADADASGGCDPTKTPDIESCLIAEQYGVFVATPDAGGIADASCGSQTAPCATIGQGIATASGASKSRIFICQGAFNEAVTATHTSLYGGFACPTDGGLWTFADASSQLIGPQNQIALTISGATSPVDIDDLWISAPDAAGIDDAGNGLSSLAVLVNGSTVTFRRCVITAGNGDNGTDGGTITNYAAATAGSGQSPAAEAGAGGEGGLQACIDGISVSTGGKGGDATSTVGGTGADGGNGAASPMPPTSPGFDGAGGPGGKGVCAGLANPGANGLGASAAAAPATALGMLTATGWLPSSGIPGGRGSPGQGGGGGGGIQLTAIGGPGGGGGAGGCGGGGGTGGRGGGGSIAVGCLNGVATFKACLLTTGVAGRGGTGGDGQPGQSGGAPGFGLCNGAQGGAGAGGSGGAGGTGGASVCVANKNSTVTGSPTCTHGTAGAPGAGGVGQTGGTGPQGPGNPGLDGGAGFPGVSQDSVQIQ